jgi:hypothetical protein
MNILAAKYPAPGWKYTVTPEPWATLDTRVEFGSVSLKDILPFVIVLFSTKVILYWFLSWEINSILVIALVTLSIVNVYVYGVPVRV